MGLLRKAHWLAGWLARRDCETKRENTRKGKPGWLRLLEGSCRRGAPLAKVSHFAFCLSFLPIDFLSLNHPATFALFISAITDFAFPYRCCCSQVFFFCSGFSESPRCYLHRLPVEEIGRGKTKKKQSRSHPTERARQVGTICTKGSKREGRATTGFSFSQCGDYG